MPKNFKIKVYDALKKVPSGKVTTYKELSRYIGTRAYRAVGHALAQNPNAPQIPCHRVVKSNGEIGGYSAPGGMRKKIKILNCEGVHVRNNKVVAFEEVFYRFGV
jgi:methylated-DNA-[protein]-cysteine S-methyltransferase